MNTHNWKHAPKDSDAFWKCQECGKLDFNAIPDTDPTCGGSISERIKDEIARNIIQKSFDEEDSTYTQEFDDFTDADPGL